MSSDALSAAWAIPDALSEPPLRGLAKIHVQAIKKSFATDEGTLDVIGGLSFSVAAGETVVLDVMRNNEPRRVAVQTRAFPE